ncbi:tyrosine-type recombinase/integrase [Marinomonas mediterranea]|jgi:Site-specific recombinase XerD|uniref:Integrase family protein n=1 Tax=Marinomonas mediterranea (strain ATCC 700492 / JCM 21426 / NBRC 103028 / MMB-1) TaxID=717774 RepID=F2K2Q8_MARM1|nr:site-specific integrase [Marinomonas mediterranea]ADZ91191.1 integrase family protein [Marinomonas mediterranea MMB-1]WCN17318.1 tyrosine-type recombinase/integrase [Marinomonas mediterranea MMB-1]
MSALHQKIIDTMTLEGLSPLTQKAYLYQIGEASRYFNLPPDRIRRADIQRYILHLIRDRGWSWSSCRQSVHALNFLYQKVLSRNRLRVALPHPNKQQRIPDLLYPNEVHRMISACERGKAKAAIMLAYATGMRAGEIVRLKVPDLDGKNSCIKIREGKGRRDRYVLFPEGLKVPLREYWRVFRPTDYVVYGLDKDRKIDTSTLRRGLKLAAQQAEIHKEVRFHSLRHAFACHQLLRGMPLPRLQILLGHQVIQTTFRYLQWIAMMDLKEESSEDLLRPLETTQ